MKYQLVSSNHFIRNQIQSGFFVLEISIYLLYYNQHRNILKMIGKELIWKQIEDKAFSYGNPNIVPTFDIFPSTVDYKDQNLMLGLTLKPCGLGEYFENVPEVCFGATGIVRCEVCKSYMNPYNPIQKSKSSYYCCLCGWLNSMPLRYEPQETAIERSSLTYDIVPFQSEFASKKVSEPHIVLLVETNYEFLRTDAYEMFVSALEYAIELMSPQQNVMLVTYDNQYVAAYDLRGEGTRYCLSLDEKPIKESVCREIGDVKQNLLKILRMLPSIYENPSFEKRSLHRRGLEYTIQCLFKIGGRIMHFVGSAIPSAGVVHVPKNKEEGFFSATVYYDRIAKICNEHAVSYSLSLFCSTESSVIQVADLCLQTRGSFQLYRTSDAAEEFYYNLIESLVGQTVFTATSRLRHSGYTVERGEKTQLNSEWEMTGNHRSSPGQLVNYSHLTLDSFVVVTVNLKENTNDRYLIIQNSCLYMRPDGATRLRISNCAIPLASSLSMVHANSNYQGLSVYFLRHEVQLLLKARGVVRTIEERLATLCKQLVFYKKHQWAQDVLLLCLALLKSKAGIKQKGMMFSKKKLQEMWVAMVGLLDLNPEELLTHFVPQLFEIPLQKSSENQISKNEYQTPENDYLPPIIPLTNTAIQDGKVYLMLTGRTIIIYYSKDYSGYRLHSEQPNNAITALIDKLSTLNRYKHYRIRQTGHNQFADQQYQDFINNLLYSEGLYELRINYQQFLELFG